MWCVQAHGTRYAKHCLSKYQRLQHLELTTEFTTLLASSQSSNHTWCVCEGKQVLERFKRLGGPAQSLEGQLREMRRQAAARDGGHNSARSFAGEEDAPHPETPGKMQ